MNTPGTEPGRPPSFSHPPDYDMPRCRPHIPGGGGAGGTGVPVVGVEKVAAVMDGDRCPTTRSTTRGEPRPCSSPCSTTTSSSNCAPAGLPECRSERVSRAVLPEPAADPIWDADEAKSEVWDAIRDEVWDAIRDEAKSEADKEPILSSFLYSSILSHDCLERALGFVLANRLQDPTLLATQLMDIFDDVMVRDRGIQDSIQLDLQAFKGRDPACASYSCALLYFKGFHSLQSYRVAHALWNQGRKVLALALQSRISEVFAVDIHPAAKIGQGILLDHGTGVVIGETAVVGSRVSLMQCVTLGGTGKETGDRHPKIGQGALIGAGATILGNITVGEGAVVAAGSLVLKDIPPHSMVAGNPAKVVGHIEEKDPSLTMKHDATKEYFQQVAASYMNISNGTCDLKTKCQGNNTLV